MSTDHYFHHRFRLTTLSGLVVEPTQASVDRIFAVNNPSLARIVVDESFIQVSFIIACLMKLLYEPLVL